MWGRIIYICRCSVCILLLINANCIEEDCGAEMYPCGLFYALNSTVRGQEMIHWETGDKKKKKAEICL